jgi:hypothetical protein
LVFYAHRVGLVARSYITTEKKVEVYCSSIYLVLSVPNVLISDVIAARAY